MVDLSKAGNNTSVDGRVKYFNKDYRTQGPLLKTDLLKCLKLIDKPSCSSYKESISKRCNFAVSDMNTQRRVISSSSVIKISSKILVKGKKWNRKNGKRNIFYC